MYWRGKREKIKNKKKTVFIVINQVVKVKIFEENLYRSL